MQILILGAAGMVGRKLTERLVKDGKLGDKAITRLILHDVVEPQRPDVSYDVETLTSDFSIPGEAEKLVAGRPDVIFHLAAIVSGEAEADLEKGYRINLDGTRFLFDAIRAVGGDTSLACVHIVHRDLRSAISGRHRRRVLSDAPHELWHAEGNRRTAAGRLYAARLLRRRRDPPSDHLRQAG